jgi:hypothetical protein
MVSMFRATFSANVIRSFEQEFVPSTHAMQPIRVARRRGPIAKRIAKTTPIAAVLENMMPRLAGATAAIRCLSPHGKAAHFAKNALAASASRGSGNRGICRARAKRARLLFKSPFFWGLLFWEKRLGRFDRPLGPSLVSFLWWWFLHSVLKFLLTEESSARIHFGDRIVDQTPATLFARVAMIGYNGFQWNL